MNFQGDVNSVKDICLKYSLAVDSCLDSYSLLNLLGQMVEQLEILKDCVEMDVQDYENLGS
jgi:hypothetical protein